MATSKVSLPCRTMTGMLIPKMGISSTLNWPLPDRGCSMLRPWTDSGTAWNNRCDRNSPALQSGRLAQQQPHRLGLARHQLDLARRKTDQPLGEALARAGAARSPQSCRPPSCAC